jgi:hypothetical protein
MMDPRIIIVENQAFDATHAFKQLRLIVYMQLDFLGKYINRQMVQTAFVTTGEGKSAYG